MDEIEIGATVRLRSGYDEVYPRAWAWSLGVAKDSRTDEYGFDQTWVEWDREDWRYNHEEDGWTYSSHLEVIERPTIAHFTEQVTNEAEQRCPNCGHDRDDETQMDRYISEISDAFEEAAGGDGFLVIAITQEPDPTDPTSLRYVPKVVSAAKSDEVADLLQNALMELVQQTWFPMWGGEIGRLDGFDDEG